MDTFIFIVIILIFLFSVILHEISHGFAADYLGDSTPRLAERLTLNPLKHLDLFGSILLPLLLILSNSNIVFGWAKPVPINPSNLKDKKYGGAKVAFAGPAANFLVALVFGFILRFLPFDNSLFIQNLVLVFGYIVWVNLLLAVFNLMPIPPLDGSHILFAFLPATFNGLKVFLLQYGIFILIFFMFFLFPLLIPLIRFIFSLIVGVPFF